jgi:hypothetical protein
MLRNRLRNVRRWLKVVVASMLLPAAVLAAPANPPGGPFVMRDRAGFDRCRPHDGFRCSGRLLELRNPFRKPVVVVLTCGPEFLSLRSTVVVPAKKGRRLGRAAVDLGTDRPGGLRAGQCQVEAWYFWRPCRRRFHHEVRTRICFVDGRLRRS